MAAYAALVSLMNIMEQIQNHPHHSFSLDNKQIESLRENVNFLLDFIEGYSHGSSKEAEVLESQIASAAYEAEDVIESHVVDQIHAGSTLKGEASSYFLFDLQKVIEEMDSIKKIAMKVIAQGGFKDQLPTYSKPAISSRLLTTGKTAMVGFDDELIELMEMLTAQQPNRQIIQIVGMGGIGKTTLAKNVYEHLTIVQHFDVRLWATISQEFNIRKILFELLGQSEPTKKTVDELGEQLHKTLSGKRYLIILDDMWNIEAWDEIQMFFPDIGSRSRTVITTRLSNMAIHSSSSFMMNFLEEDKSWKLFCQKTFGEEDCPLELLKVGKKIVEQCKGLPLLIAVIGGHLGKSSRMKEYWEYFADDINAILNSGEGEQCLSILALSYSHLPAYLKPCFLYMGIFPEDEEIRVSTLVKLWIAEGFLKPNKAQSFEDIAEDNLKDLVGRNLILVREWSRNGKIKTCNIHDLLRELSLTIAKKEKFLCVLKLFDIPQPMYRERRVAIHGDSLSHFRNPGIFWAMRAASFLRSLMGKTFDLSLGFKLLKIVTRDSELVDYFDLRHLEARFQQVNLRYLDREFRWCRPRQDTDQFLYLYLPPSISLLWNLQTLIIGAGFITVIAPSEIWEMPQLRHLMVHPRFYLRDPRPRHRIGQQDDFVLPHLQTLWKVQNFMLSEDVCKKIPNIKKLGIFYNREARSSSEYFLHNLGRFDKLESLACGFLKESAWRDFLLSLTLPCSLRKLTLANCPLEWEDLTIIGSLPHLEVLKLEFPWIKAGGPAWNPVVGGFLHLKSLIIYFSGDLIYWNADSSHFPALENLRLSGASKLAEIPSGIGEIPTLQRIKLMGCSVAAAISAMRILVEQEEELGNPGFLLEVGFWDKELQERFREMVEEEGLTSKNLRLKY